MKINDLDLKNWKEYDDIWTDSLWIIDKRDNSGAHSGHYHGNFVPQIPNQFLKRYTKKGDWMLDPFAGSGTTLIEAQRLKRNSIGIELQTDMAEEAIKRIRTENKRGITADMYQGDSRTIFLNPILEKYGADKVQFIIYHPPYWDILKFSKDEKDLSNTKTLKEFKEEYRKVVRNTLPLLEKNHYCAVVIGDKYMKGEWIPLGFYLMQIMQEEGLLLKSTVVKNFGETKGKANSHGIWRYRALLGGFYIFKHEYIFIFKKEK